MWNRFFAGPIDWQPILIALVPTTIVAWLAARYVRRLAGAALRYVVGGTLAPDSPLVIGPLRLIHAATFVLACLLLLFPALEAAGLRPYVGRTLREMSAWMFGAGLRVFLVVLVAYALRWLTDLLVRRFEHEVSLGTGADALERARRARTLGSVVNTIVTGLILGIAGIMILNEVGVNIAPVLTGAGIAGLSIGFAAQTLLRDIISGFFMILENQVRVGDVAEINDTSGRVEQLNLRTIVMRDDRGTVHVFPNGAINTLANHSKDFSRYLIDLNISYDEDPDRVAAVVREVDSDLRSDPAFRSLMLDPVEILGIVGFADWSMQLRMRLKTAPMQQWAVGREFRKRLRKALNRHGIVVPYPALRPAP